MIIEKIRIKKFGKFADVRFEFTPEINMIEGENEAGKSTLADFIVFIFFGPAKQNSPIENEWERYAPQGGQEASGSLELLCEKGRFCIERTVRMSVKNTVEETVNVVDLQKNVPVKGKDPAAMFLGVSREVFERSCFMAQSDKRAILPEHLEKAVENMLSFADESLNAERSAQMLEKEIEDLEGKEQSEGLLEELRTRAQDLALREKRAEEKETEYERLQKNLKENIKKTESNKRELEICSKRLAHADAQKRLRRIKNAGQAAEELQKARQALKSAADELSYEGFLPDRAYVKESSHMLSEAVNCRRALDDARERLENLRERWDNLPKEPEGGKGNLLVLLQDCVQKRISERNYAFVSCGAAVFALILTLVFALCRKPVGAVVCGCLFLISAVFAAWFFSAFQKTKSKEASLYARAGAESREDLERAIEDGAVRAADRRALAKSIEEEKRRCMRGEEIWRELVLRIREMAARWGKTCENVEELRDLCGRAEEAYEKIEQLTENEKQAKSAFAALETETSEEELRNLLELLRTDGIKEELSSKDYKELSVKINFYKQTSDALDARIETQRKQIGELERTMEDRFALQEDGKGISEKLAELEEQLTVKKAARDAIRQSLRYMRGQILPNIARQASEFLEQASGGRYKELTVSEEFGVCAVDAEGVSFRLTTLSGAMKELCYIALRLALVDSMFDARRMPVILDESFSNLDDLRLAAAFMALYRRAAAGKNQIFLMTCRKRETALMEKIGPIHRICL